MQKPLIFLRFSSQHRVTVSLAHVAGTQHSTSAPLAPSPLPNFTALTCILLCWSAPPPKAQEGNWADRKWGDNGSSRLFGSLLPKFRGAYSMWRALRKLGLRHLSHGSLIQLPSLSLFLEQKQHTFRQKNVHPWSWPEGWEVIGEKNIHVTIETVKISWWWQLARSFMWIISFNSWNRLVTVPILNMKKFRFREVLWPAQGHTACK